MKNQMKELFFDAQDGCGLDSYDINVGYKFLRPDVLNVTWAP